jgi:hypothetical protein
MSFLIVRANFTDLHKIAQPSKDSIKALGGVRHISDKSIGAWREHKPRLAAQLDIHGSISKDLIDLGYESDDSWLEELDGVIPDNNSSYWPEYLSRRLRVKFWLDRWMKTIVYALKLAVTQRKKE